jgi:hypothetical protein
MAPRHERGGPRAAESRPINHNRRPAAQPNDTLIVHGQGGVVDLQAERTRRREVSTDLTPAAPCTGVCTCWGAPLGGWPS